MGNEMGNRNTSSVPEQDGIENQISSEPPSDVVAAMVDDVPKSVSSTKAYEDPSDSALNEETLPKREVSALGAENSSAMERDENARAMESEDIQQATTISNVGNLSAASATERIHTAEENENEGADHKEAVMWAEECIKVEDDSLKTKEISFNDKERNGSEHEKTESSKLEIAPMQGEDKCFNEAIGDSLLDTKQSYLESEILVDASRAENERVDHKEAVMLAEECIKVKDDSWKTQEIAFKDKECNGNEHEKIESSKLEIAAMQGEDKCFNEAIGVSLLDTKQSYLESEIIIDASKTENERVDYKEADMLAEEFIKVEDDSLKTKQISFNDKDCNGSDHEKTEYSKLEIAAMQGEDNGFNEVIGASLLDTEHSYLESEILVDASKMESNVDGLSGLTVTANNVEANTSEATNPGTQNEYADKKVDGLRGLTVNTNNVEMNTSEATNPGTQNEYADKKDQNLRVDLKYQNADDDNEPESRDALQSGTQDPAVIGLQSVDMQKSTPSQASDNQMGYDKQTISDGRVDLQVHTEHENPSDDRKEIANGNSPEVEKSSVVPNQILFLKENGFGDKSTAHTTASAQELYVNMVESTTIPSYLQSVSEAEKDVNILCLPQKTLPTVESDLVESIKEIEQNICSQSGNLFSMNGDTMMERSSAENGILSRQTFISEMNNGFIRSEMEHCNEETMASAVEVTVKHSSSETDKHELDKKEFDSTVVEVMGKATSLQCASEDLQDINALLLDKKEDESCNNVVVVATATEVVEIPKCLHSTSESIQNEHKEGATNAIAVEIIEEPMILLSASEAAGDTDMSLLPETEDESCNDQNILSSDMSLLPETKDESCNDENILSSAAEELANPNCKQPAIEGYNMASTAAVVEELSDSESSHDRRLHQLNEGEDKSCSTAVVLSDGEIYQQTDKMAPSSFVSVTLSDSKVREYNIDNREIGISPLILENNGQAEQIGNELHLEKRISDQDVKNTLGAEVFKPDSFTDSIGNTEPALVESKENASEDLSAPQKQEDVAGTALHDATKENINQDNMGDRSMENVALPTADKDLPIWPSDSIEAAADRQGDSAQDITGRNIVLTGDAPDKQQTHSSLDNQVQPSEYVSCPKPESWNEQGEDDLNTPLLPTAKGLHEEKVESVSQVNSLSDDPKISLERTESGKSRTPLRNLFAEDSVSVSGGSLKSTEQGGSGEKAVQDVWGSPARLVASPTSREKQKPRSIFSQCICCTAIH